MPPPGRTWDDERIDKLYQPEYFDVELANLIDSDMKSRQFDAAVRAAAILVETRLKAKCISAGAQDAAGLSGVGLVGRAFHKDNGCLTPPWPIATEVIDGAHQLFRGFVLYVRNATAHNTEFMGKDLSAAIDLLMLCQSLLRIIDASKNR